MLSAAHRRYVFGTERECKRSRFIDELPGPDVRLVGRAAPMPLPLLKRAMAAFGPVLVNGYGQTETGQLTGYPPGAPPKPGSMGKPLPGVALEVRDGELVLADPATDPTFFVGYLGEEPHDRRAPWHPGARVSAATHFGVALIVCACIA